MIKIKNKYLAFVIVILLALAGGGLALVKKPNNDASAGKSSNINTANHLNPSTSKQNGAASANQATPSTTSTQPSTSTPAKPVTKDTTPTSTPSTPPSMVKPSTPPPFTVTAQAPVFAQIGSTPDECYYDLSESYSVNEAGTVEITSYETTDVSGQGPFINSLSRSFTGATSYTEESTNEYGSGNSHINVSAYFTFKDSTGNLLATSPTSHFTCL